MTTLIICGMICVCAFLPLAASLGRAAEPETLPNTQPLMMQGDIASQLVGGADRFLLRKLAESTDAREQYWQRDITSAEAYEKSLAPNRQRLARILGVRDARAPLIELELAATTSQPALLGKGKQYEIFKVRWPAFGDVYGEGLLLEPAGGKMLAQVIAIPDADQTPEQLVGLAEGIPPQLQFARRLAEQGYRVVVPVLISRKLQKRNGRANLSDREFVYRPAFEMGRHIIGYEVQKILAVVDWLSQDPERSRYRIAVVGYGEGGGLALYAGALDRRIDATLVSGYFEDRNRVWEQPIDRNVFGLLREFGDAELAAMIARRLLIIDDTPGPKVELPGEGGAPGKLVPATTAKAEFERAKSLLKKMPAPLDWNFVTDHEAALEKLCGLLSSKPLSPDQGPPQLVGKLPDPAARQIRQIHELDRHNQRLLTESAAVRQEFMNKLDVSSLEKYQQSVEQYRTIFREQVIGQFDDKLLSPNVRTRKLDENEKWTSYEVVLDVFPDVIAYGILLLPKNIAPGEKRPVVVCQHGLEGRPRDLISGDHPAYHDFAAKLTERGFITFAPQNLYIFTDRFRSLQRKANPLGMTLFSLIVPQHQQITEWLKSLPQVDGERIAFYGLSYGGKSAMRIPPLVGNYCLSICSADFNDWVWKNASTQSPYSYVWSGEYEIFEFDLGSAFNYAEMAALIAPRPFMVERGHFDGVSSDEAVAYEFAKVRHLYAARLGIGDRCDAEFFVGPHTINGQGTFAFLHKHLRWPPPN